MFAFSSDVLIRMNILQESVGDHHELYVTARGQAAAVSAENGIAFGCLDVTFSSVSAPSSYTVVSFTGTSKLVLARLTWLVHRIRDLSRIEMRAESKGFIEGVSSAGSNSSLGWPFGLPTCMGMHTPSPKACAETPVAFHEQFMELQTTFLVPFFSDGDGGSSSASDTDSRSEAASSFFKDSRRITLGSLIALPMENSFRTDAHYPCVFSVRRRSFLPSCGILELLGCGRNSSAMAHDLEASEDDEDDEGAAVTGSSAALAACVQLERTTSQGTDPSDIVRLSVAIYEDALSNGSCSPDWNDQFVSCHSILSGGEWTGADAGRLSSDLGATPMSLSVKSTPRLKPLRSQRMQRSSSMKSFFSSLCCRIDDERS